MKTLHVFRKRIMHVGLCWSRRCATSIPSTPRYVRGQRDVVYAAPMKLAASEAKILARITLEYVCVSQASIGARNAVSFCYAFKRSIRTHVALTFGFSDSRRLPDAPSRDAMNTSIDQINRGGFLQKPFLFDWRNPPTSTYNMCIENAFYQDLLTCVQAGKYRLELIPEHCRSRKKIVELYRKHLAHLKKCWITQQRPLPAQQALIQARHYSRNSRMGTV